MSAIETAKALDAKIAAAGGLAAYWTAEQAKAKAAGKRSYSRLIDPVSGKVVAEVTR